jgi:hypothetical protein
MTSPTINARTDGDAAVNRERAAGTATGLRTVAIVALILAMVMTA